MKASLLVTFLTSITLASILVMGVLIANMPYNPIRNSQRDVNLVGLMPQGWAFFTRSPREPQLYLYQSVEGKMTKVSYSNTGLESWFGFNRKVRFKGVEMGHLFEKVQQYEWLACEGDLNDCPELQTLPAHPVENIAQLHTLCGEYYLVHRSIVPWAWFRSGDDVHMPSKIIKISVSCSQQI